MIKAFWIVNDSKRFFICDFRDWWLVAGKQQTLTSSFRAHARNLCHSRGNGSWEKRANGKPVIPKPSRETLIQSLSDFTLEFLCIARNNLTRIASYLRKVMTKLCIKNSCKIWLCDWISVSLASPWFILRGASDFYAPHHHFAFLISNFSFNRGFHS